VLLRQLVDYAERMKDRRDDRLNAIPPVGYTNTPVKWIIPLDREGVFLGSLIPAEGKGKKGKEYACPHRPRTSTAVRPRLLADTAEYVLGIPKADSQKKQARARDCHAAFVQLVAECAPRTGEPAVTAVLRFLKGMESPPALPDDFSQSDNVTFQVDGTLPIDLPGVREFWAQYFWDRVLGGEGGEEVEEGANDSSSDEQAGPQDAPVLSSEMECVVCGTVKMPVPRHPFQIKRLPGRPAGAALISANVDAFESYGLPKSLIAPTCKECAEAYVKAANLLIDGEATSVTVGSCVYMFWTKEEHEFSPALLLSEPDPKEVKALIRSALAAKPSAVTLDDTPFYACVMTANQGRVVVRDWLETTIAEAKKNLARWFVLQEMVGEYGECDAPPLPIKGYRRQSDKRWIDGLTESTVAKIKRRRDVSRASPLTPSLLLRVALKGGALPTWLMAGAVKRNIAEQDVTRPRAALIKMVLLSQSAELSPEDTMTQLNVNNQNPAYLCGRLMGVLEALQRAALGDVGASVTSRYFGTASSAPASVFGNLLRGAQHHLDRLRKERPGTYQALQRRLEEVMAGLPAFPRVLTLEAQGLFSLGYFHQRAADRAAAIAHKQAGATAQGETKPSDINEQGGKSND
jgi:CRISPR-associated protein Csd1